MSSSDLLSAGVGAVAWGAVIPFVKFAGKAIAATEKNTTKVMVLGAVLALSIVTTPIAGKLLKWERREERIRGVAIGLGIAQTLDGLVHMFNPTFYSNNPVEANYSSAAIFFGAGTLGILSCFT